MSIIQNISIKSTGAQKKLISRYLDAVGDGSGNKNFIGDYSAAQEIAFIQPGAGEIFRIARMIVCIEDSSGFSAVDYGNIASGLTNGVQVRTHDGSSTIVDLTDGEPIKSNAGWGRFCYDVDLKTWSTGNELLLVRWTFSKSGQYVRLVGDDTEKLEVLLDDNLTGLVGHQFLVQGYIE